MADRIFISELAQAESVNGDLMFVGDDGTRTNKVKASQIADYVKENLGDVGSVKSVNEVLPDENGNILLEIPRVTNPNLLDNWYFGNPVNQRGMSLYQVGQTDGLYTIDRWYATEWYRGLKIVDGGIQHYIEDGIEGGGPIIQWLENGEYLMGKTVTVSVLVNSNLYSITGTISTTKLEKSIPGVGSVGVQYDESKGYVDVYMYTAQTLTNTSVWQAIKLELGSQQTLAHQENGVWVLNEIPNYAEELAKCQRYAVAYKTINTGFYWNCHAITNTQAYMTISLPQNIRKLPTVTFDTSAFSLRAGSEAFAISGVSVYTSNANVVVLRINSTNLTVGSVYSLRGNATTYIVFSADL